MALEVFVPDPSLLVIDDDAEICALIRKVAEGLGYNVTTTTSSRDIVRLYESLNPDVIVTDIVMPDVDGLEMLRALGKAGCKSRILVISGSGAHNLRAAQAFATFGLPSVTAMQKPIRLVALRSFLTSE